MSRSPGIIAAVVGIVRRDGKVLIAERPPNKPYAGYWEFPGGKIEPQESAQDALYRELDEELGITIQSATHLFTHEHAYPDKTVLLDIWLVDEFVGEPQGRESQQLCWATFSEMMGKQLLQGNWAIMDRIKLLFN